MKKKGFTLIELLAVIIILAIIALIATPIIMRVIENSKKGAAERSAENYVRAVETQVLALKANGTTLEDGIYKIKQNGNICPDQSTDCSEENEIKIEMNGTKPSSGKIQVKNEKVIAYQLTIGGYENKYGTISRLPEEYQEVEWIGSTGTQYIDTGITPTSINFSFSGKILMYSSQPQPFPRIFGTRYNNIFLLGFGLRFWYGDTGTNCTNELNIKDNNIHTFSANKDGVLFDSEFFALESAPSVLELKYPIYLFWSGGETDETRSNSRIYYLEIHDSDTKVRDFIPCYRKSDKKPGMYDLVEGKFYTNQGSGEDFEVGDDVY